MDIKEFDTYKYQNLKGGAKRNPIFLIILLLLEKTGVLWGFLICLFVLFRLGIFLRRLSGFFVNVSEFLSTLNSHLRAQRFIFVYRSGCTNCCINLYFSFAQSKTQLLKYTQEIIVYVNQNC